MALKPKDMRRKINASLQGESEAEQIRIIDGFLREWPPNVRGEYAEMRRQLLRRLEKLQTVQRVKASSPGGTVSINHVLSDGDLVELQTLRGAPRPR